MTRTSPDGRRNRSAPSASRPSNAPSIRWSAPAATVSGVPSLWALSSHKAINAGKSPHQRSSSRAKAAASSGAKAAGLTSATDESAAVARSGSSGALARLTPKPATTRSPARSSRTPPSLPGPSSRSLGHLRISPVAGAAASTARISATPQVSASVGAGGSVRRSCTTVLPWKLPVQLSQARPCRPRPSSCWRAISQLPSPAEGSVERSLLVEPVRSTKRSLLRTRSRRWR